MTIRETAVPTSPDHMTRDQLLDALASVAEALTNAARNTGIDRYEDVDGCCGRSDELVAAARRLT